MRFGCASTDSSVPRETYVAAAGVTPILGGGEGGGICETPIRLESVGCPAVHERRTWVSDDGTVVACRLSVCGEDRVWRRRAGHWEDWTSRLR